VTMSTPPMFVDRPLSNTCGITSDRNFINDAEAAALLGQCAALTNTRTRTLVCTGAQGVACSP
jgi:hypothetical protein